MVARPAHAQSRLDSLEHGRLVARAIQVELQQSRDVRLIFHYKNGLLHAIP